MLTVRKVGSIIEKLKEMLEEYLKKTKPKYYPPVENLLDLVYEHYTENNSIAPENTVAGKVAKEKEKELETWLRGLPRMDEMVEDYGIDIPLWEKINSNFNTLVTHLAGISQSLVIQIGRSRYRKII